MSTTSLPASWPQRLAGCARRQGQAAVSAGLRTEGLVLDVAPRDARGLVQRHGPRDVQRAPEARVRVCDDRHGAHADHHPRDVRELVCRDDRQVRLADGAARGAAPSEVEAVEARSVGEVGGDAVEGPGQIVQPSVKYMSVQVVQPFVGHLPSFNSLRSLWGMSDL